MTEALVVGLGYLLGSVPFGYLAGRLAGIDIRQVGSRNIGTTNVFRTLGRRHGIAVLVADIGKGLAAVLIAAAILDDPWPIAAAGAAVLGHLAPVWLRFRGGKGVAVAGGAIIGLMPVVSGVLVAAWALLVIATRYVSVASIAAAVLFTPLAWAFGREWPYLAFAGAVSVLVLWRHRANMARLRAGSELKIDLFSRGPRDAHPDAGAP